MEAVRAYDMLADIETFQTTQCNIPEANFLQNLSNYSFR